MTHHPHSRGNISLAVATALALATGAVFVGGMVIMGVLMAGHMGGDHMGMMRRGSSGADQTPVLSEAKQITVEMWNYEFFPAKLTVNTGAEVTWVNRDSVPHNAVASDGPFDTGLLNQGQSATLAFDASGVYSYVCTIHPNMKATLTVR